MTGTISLTQSTTQSLPLSESRTQTVRTSPQDGKPQDADTFQSAKDDETPIASLSNTENLERTKATKKPGDRSRQAFSSINNELNKRQIENNTYYSGGNFTVDGQFAYTAFHVLPSGSYDLTKRELTKDITITNRKTNRKIVLKKGSPIELVGNDSVIIRFKDQDRKALNAKARELRSVRQMLSEKNNSLPLLLPSVAFSGGNNKGQPPRRIPGYLVKYRVSDDRTNDPENTDLLNRSLFIPLDPNFRFIPGDSGSIVLTKVNGKYMESRGSGGVTPRFSTTRTGGSFVTQLTDKQIQEIKKAMIQEGFSNTYVKDLNLRTAPELMMVSPPSQPLF